MHTVLHCAYATFVLGNYQNFDQSLLWQYGMWSFQMGDTKLERLLPKNQHTQRKLLNFENWTNGGPEWLAKIKLFKVDYFDFSCKKIE